MQATVEKGKLNCPHWNFYFGDFTGTVEIKKYKKTRTNEQNRLYWAYITDICNETGDNIEDTHEFLKRKLLPPRFITVMGQEVKIPGSTTKLNTKEFGEFIEKIVALTGISFNTEII